MLEIVDAVAHTLDQVRQKRPLIHIITNHVTMIDVANATLAIGARPVMALAPEEVEGIAAASNALVLNLGTPTRERVDSMERAGRIANTHDIPIVFDPVGIGASRFRQFAATRLMALKIAIFRGNADEVAVLAGMNTAMSGVDSVLSTYDRVRVVRKLGQQRGSVYVASGATDYASDGSRTCSVANGSPRLQQITGAGDMLDAIIASAAAVESDKLIAAVSGLVWMGVAAEIAAESTPGIGTFHVKLFDAFGELDSDKIRARCRVELKSDRLPGDS